MADPAISELRNMIGLFLGIQVLLPILVIYWTVSYGGGASLSGGSWWSWLVAASVLLAGILAFCPWAQFVPYAALFIFPAAMVASAYWRDGVASAVASAAVLGGAYWAARRWFNDGRAPAGGLHIPPPLGPGVYFVAQGGGGAMVNHHHSNESQRFALDILRLNRFGMRARGLFPLRRERFAIYGMPVLSPCDGFVTAVVDGLEDMDPWVRLDVENVAGNHIVLRCGGPESDTFIGLAHLQPGSVAVRPGQKVFVGQPLARVGNSGRTTEPHLHIHAKVGGEPNSMLDGRGIPLRIRGRFLMRNDVFCGQRAPARRDAALFGSAQGAAEVPPAGR